MSVQFVFTTSSLDLDSGRSRTALENPYRARRPRGKCDRCRVCPRLLVDAAGREVGNPVRHHRPEEVNRLASWPFQR